ncbi:hypothetical protein IAE37_000304 [Pseudomonas sp. S31]|uniref:hypothetical protein n=1 Tax=Pseudomonas sp. S31 TaxID=1564473 RepID=UPI001913070F|nr:hypothetical protein [Pseudomonas sp. S31]MBK4998028.1 hypothetical protein [Pseudomonas sp. S31]
MNQHENAPKANNAMHASLNFSGQTLPFTTEDVVSGEHFGRLWVQGYQATRHPNSQQETFTQITLQFPEKDLAPGKVLIIGNGEGAEISAYLGSTRIGRSGYATQGEITITHWDNRTRTLSATFNFDVEATQGDVQVMSGTLDISLAAAAATGKGFAKATLDPIINPALGHLDARSIHFIESSDGVIRLRAVQEGASAKQGVWVNVGQHSARVFFIIDNGLYDAFGEVKAHWDAQAKKLTLDAEELVFTYQGVEHKIANLRIDATQA